MRWQNRRTTSRIDHDATNRARMNRATPATTRRRGGLVTDRAWLAATRGAAAAASVAIDRESRIGLATLAMSLRTNPGISSRSRTIPATSRRMLRRPTERRSERASRRSRDPRAQTSRRGRSRCSQVRDARLDGMEPQIVIVVTRVQAVGSEVSLRLAHGRIVDRFPVEIDEHHPSAGNRAPQHLADPPRPCSGEPRPRRWRLPIVHVGCAAASRPATV